MKNRFIFANPKALDLDAIRNTSKRVTLGLKCNPSLKLSLAEEAHSRGMTLSQHVEDLLQNNNFQKLNLRVSELSSKLKFYENYLLRNMFEANKDKVKTYVDRQGKVIHKKINTIQDVYTILVNSFKQ
jgi:AraC-like DNA-binding protein